MPGVSAFGSTLKLVKRITSIGVIDTITEVLKARIADGDGSFYTTANPLPTMFHAHHLRFRRLRATYSQS